MRKKCSCRIATGEQREWPVGSGRMFPRYRPCTNDATRYMRVGTDVVEYVCEQCYWRDIDSPGAVPATESEYHAWMESDGDD